MASRPLRIGALVGTLLCVCSVLPSEPSRSAPGLTEVELKAVFLLRLPQFVSWSDERRATNFCTTEASEVSNLLAEMVATEPRGRSVRLIEVGQADGCDVVFGPAGTLSDTTPVEALLVSDEPGYAKNGGMVELKRRGARIGLVVNLDALESVGLRASSKLLQLSEVVGEGRDD